MTHPAIVFGSLSVVAALLAVRIGLNIYARKRCEALLPPRNYLTWLPSAPTKGLVVTKSFPPAPEREGAHEGRIFDHSFEVEPGPQPEPFLWSPVTAAAIADGALQGLPIVQAISQIDPAVLHAVAASTANHIDSLPSVHSYIQAHFFDAPITSADGWFERLTGYVAEQKAASALEAAGHHVTFAATANNPVWDLMVDGHPVQVKEGLAGVKQFLIEHHGIAVFTGSENAAAIKDPLVHGIHGLDSDAIHAITQHSVDGVSHAFDPGFHFPIVTLAFSAYRQTKYLLEERIQLSTAAARVACDVTGVAAGSFLGAKTGALIGAILGPVGAAVGGLLGAIGGAVAGKTASKSIQNAPFNNARMIYEKTADQAKLALDSAVNESQVTIRQLQSGYETRYRKLRMEIEAVATSRIEDLSREHSSSLLAFAEQFPQYLNEIKTALYEQEQIVLATLPGRGFWAYFIPGENDHMRSAVQTWFKTARKVVAVEGDKFRKIEPRTLLTLRAEIERFMRSYAFELDSLNDHLTTLAKAFESRRTKALGIKEEASERVQRERDSLIRNFGKQVDALHEKLVEQIQTWNNNLASAMGNLKREGRAVGVDI